MRRPIAQRTIRPKVSTMPRQKSEAAAFLDIYKLTVEKKRLEQELEYLDQRRVQINQRLTVLDQQVNGLEHTVEDLRQASPPSSASKSSDRPEPPRNDIFDMLTLDY
jgi:chromosome segregation ATPase